jgi:hypothetical protein
MSQCLSSVRMSVLFTIEGKYMTTKTTTSKHKLPFRIVLAGLAALLVAPTVAQARSQGSALGYPEFGSDAGCFNEVSGGIKQTCSAAKRWMMPLVLDNNFGLNVTIGAKGNGSNQDVICQTFSFDQNGGSARFGGQQWTVFADRRVEQLVLPINPHGFGTTRAICVMRQSTQLLTVNY